MLEQFLENNLQGNFEATQLLFSRSAINFEANMEEKFSL